ncbi:serine/threonine protein kinase [Bacillaceae bacterium SIJ1]|uniref:serine/threonine protein kinase n=1 Tax=Litoribacterium kuwaitense TaxID=1398745 RepID=UPI0013EDA90E|nr:serine/threonine-protein kinase [Litoribacterium kuwaitense]NGP44440.1 serine/threonine protein kinase [Litoribacterium kuwaitense]
MSDNKSGQKQKNASGDPTVLLSGTAHDQGDRPTELLHHENEKWGPSAQSTPLKAADDTDQHSDRHEVTFDDTVLLADDDDITLIEDVEPGDIIHERYIIHDVLGQGGMGKVFLAQDSLNEDAWYAIKQSSMHPVFYRSFIDEAKMLMRLEHENLPQMVDFFSDESMQKAWLVMEYIEGQTLYERFEAAGRQMEEDDIVRIALQLCHVLDYLHHSNGEPIIYRDLKPGNIMIDPQGLIKLIDFGIAREYKAGQTQDTVQIGTVGFAAPEQFEDKQTDERTDLFSLGAVMYYLATGGKYVYANTRQTNLLSGFGSPELESIVNRLVRMNPAERYRSAKDVQNDLFLLHGDQGTTLLDGSKRAGVKAALTTNMNVTSVLLALCSFIAAFGLAALFAFGIDGSTIRDSFGLSLLQSLSFEGQTTELSHQLMTAWSFSVWEALTWLHGGALEFSIIGEQTHTKLSFSIQVISLLFLQVCVLFTLARLAYRWMRRQGPMFLAQKWPLLLLSSILYSLLITVYASLFHPTWQYRGDELALNLSASTPAVAFFMKSFLLAVVAQGFGMQIHRDIHWPVWFHAMLRSLRIIGLGMIAIMTGMIVQYSLTSSVSHYHSAVVTWGEMWSRSGTDVWYFLLWPNVLFQQVFYSLGASFQAYGEPIIHWLGAASPFSAHILLGISAEAPSSWITDMTIVVQQAWPPYAFLAVSLFSFFQMRHLPARFLIRIVGVLTVASAGIATMTSLSGYSDDADLFLGTSPLMTGMAVFIVSSVFLTIVHWLRKSQQSSVV